ncbi:M23 family metallopeptidase [Peribacillus huizhouensis]|uniref:Murein DD-endopeptidase MepM/ murein hydrolase activator NlpD n=1 Tax=Peribacillus huizhouensis TaxID=1501239 RepID=A0ABR6CR41_9BACI|nr:M23 family metallopeptidase [Peribacillus huizhouensis]MBA9027497.1 murein DD-endopeptidase MepM/ murein hydrolase activator NlpD [Peribacillus huizhouensis]
MKFRITSPYGELSEVRGHVHRGIDFAMPEGTTLRTITDGTVERVMNFGGKNLGKGVEILNQDGTTSIYGHMSNVSVKVGDKLHAGDVIGLSGNTGHSTGPHLHYAMKDGAGAWIDPSPVAEQVSAVSGGGGNWFLEQYNNFADWVIGKQVEVIVNPFVDMLHDGLNAITATMPEIGGFLTIAVGVLIMVTGRAGKWLGWWSVCMTGVIVWIINANS